MTPGYDYVPYSPPITTASGQQDLGFRIYVAPRPSHFRCIDIR